MDSLITDIYQKYRSSTGVCTDTRNLKEGNIFFALKGESFNGNQFASQAIEKGAGYAVIDESKYEVKNKTILVEDTLKTLQELAGFHRAQLKIPVLALTGSNGKTTTKELIKAVLSKKYKTFATLGNLNNHIGVPLSLLSVTDDIEMAIIEMGANHVGEISFLCSLSKPSYGLITNIGKAHIGEFGSFEAIIRAKSELYHFLIKNKGQVFINSNQEILTSMSKRFESPVFYPNEGDYYHCELVATNPFVTIKSESGATVKTNLVGRYNFENIAAALCLGKYFNVPENQAFEAMAGYFPSNNRSQIIKKNTNTVILDAYNANPSSMEAALQNLSEMNASHKIAILGDMFELGPDTEREHRKIGSLLSELNIDQSFVCGSNMAFASLEHPAAKHFETKDELINHLNKNKIENSLILLKGSRGMGLEKLLEYM